MSGDNHISLQSERPRLRSNSASVSGSMLTLLAIYRRTPCRPGVVVLYMYYLKPFENNSNDCNYHSDYILRYNSLRLHRFIPSYQGASTGFHEQAPFFPSSRALSFAICSFDSSKLYTSQLSPVTCRCQPLVHCKSPYTNRTYEFEREYRTLEVVQSLSVMTSGLGPVLPSCRSWRRLPSASGLAGKALIIKHGNTQRETNQSLVAHTAASD